MNKKITSNENKANMLNPNKRTDGQNQQRAKTEGNHGKQVNPNRVKPT